MPRSSQGIAGAATGRSMRETSPRGERLRERRLHYPRSGREQQAAHERDRRRGAPDACCSSMDDASFISSRQHVRRQIQRRENEEPHDIDEMPVQAADGQRGASASRSK